MALGLTAHVVAPAGRPMGHAPQGAIQGATLAGVLAAAMVMASLAHAQAGGQHLTSETGARPSRQSARKSGLKTQASPPEKLRTRDSRSPADRIDRRDASSRNNGTMRFGDTEVRIGGRASFGYGYSGR